MLSTPINALYANNPIENMVYLASLNEHDTNTYTLGYVSAMQQVMEALSDTKRRFLSVALQSDDEERQARLMTYVRLLDNLDLSISERVKYLEDSILSGPSGEV